MRIMFSEVKLCTWVFYAAMTNKRLIYRRMLIMYSINVVWYNIIVTNIAISH